MIAMVLLRTLVLSVSVAFSIVLAIHLLAEEADNEIGYQTLAALALPTTVLAAVLMPGAALAFAPKAMLRLRRLLLVYCLYVLLTLSLLGATVFTQFAECGAGGESCNAGCDAAGPYLS